MSLVPAKYNFTIYQGATFFKRIVFMLDGEIEPLNSYSAELTIKDQPEGDVLLVLNDTTPGGITLGGAEGTITLVIDSDTTSDLTWETGVYELLITDGSDRTDVLIRGGFKVVPF